ncbi:putative NADH-flavin reductase [Nocardia tenerifensis]|uniref:Putative NADH-flavin reductase n=1 Tax=Nocardia tenerifensis TaxID=228006 RepID=A0A318JXT3_9NOCA|nr:NAD(P)H-binding protein [Nocardia tenerifensis]PXX61788.1 putative NADH-flavin reductase [Nocardia tenerifensis]
MKLVVFGANGQTGRLIVKQALAAGHDVTAAVRRPHEFPLQGTSLRVEQADAMNVDAVDRVVAGQEAVISALGGAGYTKEQVSIYSQGIANIIKAMTAHNVRRLACVSTTAVTFQTPPGEDLVHRILFKLLIRMGRTVYEDNARMEENVRGSDLDWTIIRAAGLFDRDTRTDYEIRTPGRPGHYTARIDLADALIRAVVENRHAGQVIEAITTEGTPTVLDIVRKEVFGRADR